MSRPKKSIMTGDIIVFNDIKWKVKDLLSTQFTAVSLDGKKETFIFYRDQWKFV